MEVVPSLGDLGSTVVGRACTGSSFVVARTTATDVGQSTVTFGKRILKLANRVGSSVARLDASGVQPTVSWQATVVENGSLEELYDLLMLDVFGAIARHVESGEAGAVLAEFMAPEVAVGGTLIDPIFLHPCQEVVFAKGLEEGVD